MKKLLTAAVTTAVGMAFAGSALATETRINSLSAAGGLGGGFNEKSITIHDSSNINTFPQYMVQYKNSVDVDNTAGSTYGSMNIRYALSDDPAPPVLMLFGKRSAWEPVTNQGGIMKTAAGAPANTPFSLAGGLPGYTGRVADATNQQFGIGFGMKAGESVRLGGTLSIGGNRNDNINPNSVAPSSGNPVDDEQSNTWIDFNAGIGFDINEVNSLDFGLNIMAGTFTNMLGGQARYASNGLYGIALTAKGEFMVSQISKIVPFLRINYDSRSVVGVSQNQGDQFGSQVGTVNNTWIILGSDLAIAPPNMEGVLIQPGVGMLVHMASASGNATPGGTVTTAEDASNLMPWYGFAAEAKAFEWLYLRLGARQVISRTNQNNTTLPQSAGAPGTTNETHFSTVTNTVSTGFGIKLMGWDLDLNVNPAFFNNGIAVVTGNATGAPAGSAPGAGWAIDWALGYDW